MRQPGGVGVPWGSSSRACLLQGHAERSAQRQQEELGLLSLPSSLVCSKAICSFTKRVGTQSCWPIDALFYSWENQSTGRGGGGFTRHRPGGTEGAVLPGSGCGASPPPGSPLQPPPGWIPGKSSFNPDLITFKDKQSSSLPLGKLSQQGSFRYWSEARLQARLPSPEVQRNFPCRWRQENLSREGNQQHSELVRGTWEGGLWG